MEEFHGTKSTIFNQENSSNSALLGQVVLHDFILKYTEGLDDFDASVVAAYILRCLESPIFNEIVPNLER